MLKEKPKVSILPYRKGTYHHCHHVRANDGFTIYITNPYEIKKHLTDQGLNLPQINANDIFYFYANKFIRGSYAYSLESSVMKDEYYWLIGFRNEKDAFAHSLKFPSKRLTMWRAIPFFVYISEDDHRPFPSNIIDNCDPLGLG